MPHDENHPLPDGWVKEFDRSSGAPFFVDTRATPPRSIWTHPYDDEEYRSKHPQVGEKTNLAPPPAYEDNRRHSFPGGSSGQSSSPAARSDPNLAHAKKRGFLGKMKDKAIGTKEERAEKQRQEDAYRRQVLEQRREALRNAPPQMYAAPMGGFGGNRMGGGGMFGGGGYGQPGYGGGGMGMGGGMGGMGGGMGRRGGGGGMGGMALPLLGGIGGGLLLGDMLDGGFGGGGFDGGGGGFDGGGGDFGGGGF